MAKPYSSGAPELANSESAASTWYRIATVAFAIAIFIVDSATHLEIAVSVLYVAVVLMAARFLSSRGTVLVAAGCVALTVISSLLTPPVEFATVGVANTLISISAIVIAAFLVRRGQSVNVTLKEQAHLLSLTHDAIFVRDLDGVIKYWSRGAEALYGWSAEQARGKVAQELLKTEFPVPFRELEEELNRTGRWEGELVHTKQEGTPVVVASRWSLQRDDNGMPTAILTTNNDISERKRVEQSREEIEEQWRASFENNPTMYFIIDAAGAIVTVNTFGAEQLGYSVSELLGQQVLNVFVESDKAAVQEHAKACFEQPGRTMRWEARKIRKDGSMLWVRETANAVFLKKRPVLLIICEDISEQKRAEEAARRSEKELRNLIETIPVMVFSIRPDGSTEFVSRNWKDYAGFSLEDTTANGWLATVHPDDVDTHFNKWRASMVGGRPFENEVRHRSLSGEYRWFLVRTTPLRDQDGNILKWYGTLTDIEDRKRAEEALRRSEAYLAEAQRLSHTGSWALNVVTGENTHSSEEHSRLFGFDPELGLPSFEQFYERIHPQDRATVAETFERAIRERTDFEVDARTALPDNTIKYIHGVGHPVFDGDGDLVEYVGTVVDVTERKLAEEELHAAETRFRTYVDHATDGLIVHDEQGRIIDVNRQACESLGYARDELVGASVSLFDCRVDAAFHEWVKRQLATGGVCTFEATHRCKGGTDLPVEVRLRQFSYGGHSYALRLVRDITDRKRAEEERERLRQLEAELARINRTTTMGELTASLAHEINQPIAAAVTNANTSVRWLAGEAPNLDEAREAAKRAVKDATRAAEIINRIRSLFRKGEAQREWVDVNDIIDDITVLLRNDAVRYAVSIHCELCADLPQVMADRVQLQQVLMNLMANSIDAMKEIDGARELTLVSRRDGSGQVLVSVSDNGVGLPTEVEQIFNAFFTTKPHGIGMGLAISRNIIESHGGRLWANSNSGRGATFYFTLPARSEARA
jgi:PAS domain S-box-containing protein